MIATAQPSFLSLLCCIDLVAFAQGDLLLDEHHRACLDELQHSHKGQDTDAKLGSKSALLGLLISALKQEGRASKGKGLTLNKSSEDGRGSLETLERICIKFQRSTDEDAPCCLSHGSLCNLIEMFDIRRNFGRDTLDLMSVPIFRSLRCVADDLMRKKMYSLMTRLVTAADMWNFFPDESLLQTFLEAEDWEAAEAFCMRVGSEENKRTLVKTLMESKEWSRAQTLSKLWKTEEFRDQISAGLKCDKIDKFIKKTKLYFAYEFAKNDHVCQVHLVNSLIHNGYYKEAMQV
eukprot:587452-Hanusia_phi.AAC.1